MFISALSVQDVPSQISLLVKFPAPPAKIAEVCIPISDPDSLPVLTSATSVHDEPSQDSVFPIPG